MVKSEKLLKTTTYYTLGNLGSKVISFLIVPLYTYYISPEEMGTIDVLAATSIFLIPIIIIQMTDGLIRWLLDKTQNQSETIHCALNVVIRNLVIALPVIILVLYLFNIPYRWWFLLSLYSSAVYTVLMQILRGLGDNKLYAALGVVNAFIIVILNYILIVHLHFGPASFFLSSICSCIIPSGWILIKKYEIRESFNIPVSKKLANEMMSYSLLLLPNALNWQIMNISDRYVVLFFLGTAWNGIYSIANKFPTLISMLTSLFYMSWQESAITEYISDNKQHLGNEQMEYYSSVFTQYYRFLFPIAILAISVTKPYIQIFMSLSYADSWRYTGFLYLGAVFSAFSSFYGIAYQLARNTRGAMITSTIGSAVNLLISLIFVQYMGLQAVVIATFVAFLVMFIARVFETKEYYGLTIKWHEFIILMVLSLICVIAPMAIDGILLQFIIFIIGAVLFLTLNGRMLLKILSTYGNWLSKLSEKRML